MKDFKNLFSAFSIGGMELKNRLVMPPMATYYAEANGMVSPRLMAYYLERARGGVGYITFEHTGVLESGRAHARMALLTTDDHIAGFRDLAEAIHGEGAKFVIQISHAGRQTSSKATGTPLVAPSAIACPVCGEVPNELTKTQILDIIEAFALAAARVKKAGADGVEIHMAHGYLLSQFLSPVSNKRTDGYGGDLHGRLAVPLKVLTAVRDRVDEEYPIICRINADDYIPGGNTLSDAQKIAKALEENGANAIHVSAGQYPSIHMIQPSFYLKEGTLLHLAEGVKSTVSIPVIAVGRIRTPEMAESIIASGKADLVSMGRALIADPQLPQKAMEGRTEEIVPCISDNACSNSLRAKGGMRCSVNPRVGRETESPVSPPSKRKAVWIIGGGPAGMKAAQISALRDHDVTLFEKNSFLGGRFVLASVPPGKQVFREFVDHMIRQTRLLGVKVLTGREFHPDQLAEERPDAVVVATGSSPAIPDLPGLSDADYMTDEQVLGEHLPPGQKILVIGGGGIGSETADYLSENGKEVTLVEMRDRIAEDLPPQQQPLLRKRLKEKGVNTLTSTKVLRFEGNDWVVEGPKGVARLSGFDHVVISMGSKSNNSLAEELKDKVAEIHVVGDASAPINLMEALLDVEEKVRNI